MATEKSPEQVKYKAGEHPNSLKNLKPFKPGENGTNPGKGYSLRAELKHALNKEARARLIQSTIDGAIAREPTPFKEVWDRVDGRLQDTPPQGNDNRVINFIISGEQGKELIEGISERLNATQRAG